MCSTVRPRTVSLSLGGHYTQRQTVMPFKKHVPPRLSVIFQDYDTPLYFVTFCTLNRISWLACLSVHEAFLRYAGVGVETGRAAVGRYVIMPDHIHLFVRVAQDEQLGRWIAGLKHNLSASLPPSTYEQGKWQPGFFDHMIRHDESYAETWNYVRENPVRKGLVQTADAWPYQGEVVHINRV